LLPFVLHQLSASESKLCTSSLVFSTVLLPFVLHQLSASQDKSIVYLKYLVGCVFSRYVIKPYRKSSRCQRACVNLPTQGTLYTERSAQTDKLTTSSFLKCAELVSC
jgi:hypothetical protein